MNRKGRHFTVLGCGEHARLVRAEGWEWVERTGVSGIVGIVAITDRGELILVEQYRRAVDRRVIELPAGLAGDVAGQEGEELIAAARRELVEETGYHAGRMVRLAEGPPSAGLCSEVITLFLAIDLQRTGPGGGGESEDIRVYEVELEKADAWLAAAVEQRGVLIDPKVYAGLYFATGWKGQDHGREGQNHGR